MKKPLFQVLTLATAILICSAQAVAENSTGLKPLSLGEIKAGGWMKNQIERDITSGYISVYDQIQPSLSKNTFGPVKSKNYSISKILVVPI